MVKLDTHEARTDLTSRECAKLICALLYAGKVHDMNEAVVRAGLRAWRTAIRHEPLVDDSALHVDLTALDRYVLLMIYALIGGLDLMAAPGALMDAVTWVIETDAVWTRFDKAAN